MFHLIVFPLGLSRFVTPGRSNVQDMRWNSTTTQNKFQVFWQENSQFRIITENKFLVKIMGNIFNFLVQGEKIRKFQFDKKETCVSKLLMKFTHTHKIWFGEGKIQTIQLFTELNGIWQNFVKYINISIYKHTDSNVSVFVSVHLCFRL